MAKIYLAVSKIDKESFEGFQKNLTGPDTELISIDINKTIERSEVQETIRLHSFETIITEADFIDDDWLQSYDSGKVIVFDPSKKLETKKEHITLCETIDEIRTHILTMKLENPILKVNSENLTTKAERKQNKPDTAAAINSEEKTVKTNDNPESEDANTSKPQTIDIFPKKDNKQGDKTPDATKKNTSDYLPENADKIKHFYKENNLYNRKTIGIWSPKTIGVSTFVLNFAIYLKKFKELKIAVMEYPNNQQILKSVLTRYDSLPPDWHSFREFSKTNTIPVESTNWVYRRIRWLPLGENDSKMEWTEEVTKDYFNITNTHDIVLVDIPTGEMNELTLDSLHHLNELWILIDDSFHQHLDWKNYISSILKKHNVTAKLIYYREFPHSRVKKVSQSFTDDMDIEFMTALPEMSKAVSKNNYEKFPMFDKRKVREAWEPKLDIIAEHLLGSEYVERYKLNIWQKLKRLLARLLQ
ncbi:hypothetical protein AWM68_17745 [Fictibacillus phosphorivorans]|uniref:Uncharacterized protein n=1 Tax=Fictibacillus phosphorivorans TaxID=1221500 RepID=A0A165NX66_9BACL|nr:hypothetical protein [Fictibacillus phosphorivorans]KZE68015.1 hypothetical protein AWM68_17745 [Fictibacillus phosphorivorans]